MKNHKLIAFSLASALVLLLSSCGAPSVALLFCWIRTVEHDAEYFKVEKNGGTAERKTDEDKMDIKNGSFSVFSSISSRGEKFKYEFPNTMHETKGAPYGISLRIENTSGTIDCIQLKKAAVTFRESEKDLLGAMVYSDNSEKRNFVITSDKIYGEHHSSYGPASKKRHKSFSESKKFSFRAENGEQPYTTGTFSISLPAVDFDGAETVSLHYEFEIFTADGKSHDVKKDADFILKTRTTKMRNQISSKKEDSA